MSEPSTSEPHRKHPKFPRRRLGHYAPTEFALVGTLCQRMNDLMLDWQRRLGEEARTLVVRGKFKLDPANDVRQIGLKRLEGDRPRWDEYDDRLYGGDYDLALVNGNHYPAARQIVYVDPVKAGTLERRRHQLTDVVAVVLDEGQDVPAWLRAHLAETDQSPPVWPAAEADERAFALVKEAFRQNLPPLRALVLAGGRSQRMGRDKAQLAYRDGEAELARLVGLCTDGLGLETYVSVSEAAADPLPGTPTVTDRFLGMGPMGAIASALLSQPDSAWLVLACDLPLLELADLECLVAARDTRRHATAARAAEKPWPEPLVAIYEPRAYRRFLDLLSLGYSCPRKLLINGDTREVDFGEGRALYNANTPEERAEALALIQS